MAPGRFLLGCEPPVSRLSARNCGSNGPRIVKIAEVYLFGGVRIYGNSNG